METDMRRLTTGVGALAIAALTACEHAPTAPRSLDAGARAEVADVPDAIDDAVDRLLPSLGTRAGARALGARLLAARGALQAGDTDVAALTIDAALRELAAIGGEGADGGEGVDGQDADAAELDAIRLDLE